MAIDYFTFKNSAICNLISPSVDGRSICFLIVIILLSNAVISLLSCSIVVLKELKFVGKFEFYSFESFRGFKKNQKASFFSKLDKKLIFFCLIKIIKSFMKS